MSMQPTEKQVEWLNKKNIPVPSTKAEASKLLDAAFNADGNTSSGGSGYANKKPYTKRTVKRNIGDAPVDAATLTTARALKAAAFAIAKDEYPEEDESGMVFSIAYGQWKNILASKFF